MVKSSICRVVDLEELRPTDNTPSVFLRVEISKLARAKTFEAVVYRLESFRMIPSFGQATRADTNLADHQVFRSR